MEPPRILGLRDTETIAMNDHSSSRSIGILASVAVAVVAALAVIATGVLGGAGASPRPSTSMPPPIAPVPSPSNNPSGGPIVDQPPVGPSDDAGDGVDFVDLINLPGVDSSVVVWDESDNLADAWSGTPDRDGPVAHDVIEAAGSVDGSTIRLTWSDLPIASRAQLSGPSRIKSGRVRGTAPKGGPSSACTSKSVVPETRPRRSVGLVVRENVA